TGIAGGAGVVMGEAGREVAVPDADGGVAELVESPEKLPPSGADQQQGAENKGPGAGAAGPGEGFSRNGPCFGIAPADVGGGQHDDRDNDQVEEEAPALKSSPQDRPRSAAGK